MHLEEIAYLFIHGIAHALRYDGNGPIVDVPDSFVHGQKLLFREVPALGEGIHLGPIEYLVHVGVADTGDKRIVYQRSLDLAGVLAMTGPRVLSRGRCRTRGQPWS